METYRELIFRGTEAQLNGLAGRLEEHAQGDWQRNHEVEKKAGVGFGSIYCFVYSPEAEKGPAGLWLAPRGNNELYVSNIVPWKRLELSRREYNGILEDFHAKVAIPATEGTGIEVELTNAAVDLDVWLSESALQRLKAFSALANRSTGKGHPLDHKRWLDFVIQAHIDDSELDSTMLSRWLHEEEGWSEEKAFDLASDYEEARSVLRAYDDSGHNG